jgi:hypothetical protein
MNDALQLTLDKVQSCVGDFFWILHNLAVEALLPNSGRMSFAG